MTKFLAIVTCATFVLYASALSDLDAKTIDAYDQLIEGALFNVSALNDELVKYKAPSPKLTAYLTMDQNTLEKMQGAAENQVALAKDWSTKYMWHLVAASAKAAKGTIDDTNFAMGLYVKLSVFPTPGYDSKPSMAKLDEMKKTYAEFLDKTKMSEQIAKTELLLQKAFTEKTQRKAAIEELVRINEAARQMEAEATALWITTSTGAVNQLHYFSVELDYMIQYARWIGHDISQLTAPYIKFFGKDM